MTRHGGALSRGARSRPRLAHLLAALGLLLDGGALLLLVPQAGDAAARLDGNTLGGYVLGATYPVVGWIIASRRPRNAIGWIFLAIGLSQALDTFAGQYATVGLVSSPGSLPAADLLSWVAVWAWAPGFTLLLTGSVLLFPDGHLPSRRWRPVIWLAGVALVLLMVPVAIMGWPSRGPELLGSGPVESSDPTVSAMVGLQFVGLILLAVSALVSVAGMVVRFRRSRGAERAQLKWFAAAAIVEVVMLIGSAFFTLPGQLANALLTLIVSPLLPIAATIAIFRYRLYDIDRIIGRSVSYVALTVLLASLFAGLVVTLQEVLTPVTRTNGVAVAGSTLVVAALSQPLRRRLQHVVDRRFNRAAFDADRVVDGFAGRIRDEVDVNSVTGALTEALGRTVEPTSAVVWLRGTVR